MPLTYWTQSYIILGVTCFKCSLHLYDSLAIFFSSINQFPVLLLINTWQTSSIGITILSYKPLHALNTNTYFIIEVANCSN